MTDAIHAEIVETARQDLLAGSQWIGRVEALQDALHELGQVLCAWVPVVAAVLGTILKGFTLA